MNEKHVSSASLSDYVLHKKKRKKKPLEDTSATHENIPDSTTTDSGSDPKLYPLSSCHFPATSATGRDRSKEEMPENETSLRPADLYKPELPVERPNTECRITKDDYESHRLYSGPTGLSLKPGMVAMMENLKVHPDFTDEMDKAPEAESGRSGDSFQKIPMPGKFSTENNRDDIDNTSQGSQTTKRMEVGGALYIPQGAPDISFLPKKRIHERPVPTIQMQQLATKENQMFVSLPGWNEKSKGSKLPAIPSTQSSNLNSSRKPTTLVEGCYGFDNVPATSTKKLPPATTCPTYTELRPSQSLGDSAGKSSQLQGSDSPETRSSSTNGRVNIVSREKTKRASPASIACFHGSKQELCKAFPLTVNLGASSDTSTIRGETTTPSTSPNPYPHDGPVEKSASPVSKHRSTKDIQYEGRTSGPVKMPGSKCTVGLQTDLNFRGSSKKCQNVRFEDTEDDDNEEVCSTCSSSSEDGSCENLQTINFSLHKGQDVRFINNRKGNNQCTVS